MNMYFRGRVGYACVQIVAFLLVKKSQRLINILFFMDGSRSPMILEYQ